MNIKVVGDVQNTLTTNISNFKLDLKNNTPNIVSKPKEIEIFKVGDRVKHYEENLTGTIKFMGDSGISVLWDDNSRERFGNCNQLKLLTESKLIEKALDVIEENIDNNIQKIDIQTAKFERKLNEIDHNKTNELNNKIKIIATNEIIDLAIRKGFIDEDDREIEYQKIICMSDEEYEIYKNEILDFEIQGEVSSTTSIEEPLTEAERMLKKVKNGGGIIGDFSKDVPTTSNYSSESGKRSLSDISDNKFTFNNQYTIDSFEDQFTNILSSHIEQSQSKQVTASHKPKVELPGFENLQGLTKPIQIAKNTESGSSVNFGKLFSELNWTTIK